MSIGVCVAGTIIYIWPEAKLADPVCTFLFSVLVCITVTPIVKSCVNVLMEGAPTDLDTDKLYEELEGTSTDPDNQLNIHEFHIWSISMGKYAMSAHIETKTP